MSVISCVVVGHWRRAASVAQLKATDNAQQKPLQFEQRKALAWTQRSERHDGMFQLLSVLVELCTVHKPVVDELLHHRQTSSSHHRFFFTGQCGVLMCSLASVSVCLSVCHVCAVLKALT